MYKIVLEHLSTCYNSLPVIFSKAKHDKQVVIRSKNRYPHLMSRRGYANKEIKWVSDHGT